MKHYRLTEKTNEPDKDLKFAIETKLQIEKNFPGVTMLKDNCCWITWSHWEFCKDYVQKKCIIKPFSDVSVQNMKKWKKDEYARKSSKQH